VTFATNRLLVVVPKGNPAGISSVEDVAREGVKLVVAAEGVPVGDYTRTVLEALGLNAALENVVSEEDDVKGVVGKVALGEADAGFVYATDVKPVEGDVEVVEIPAEAQPPVEYQAAIVVGTENRARAEAFLQRLLGDEGRAALTAAGFGLP
jgi:molybdate transport system substrate-binding protein